MKTRWILCVVLVAVMITFGLVEAQEAGDNQVSELVRLQAKILMLRSTIEHRDEQIEALKEENVRLTEKVERLEEPSQGGEVALTEAVTKAVVAPVVEDRACVGLGFSIREIDDAVREIWNDHDVPLPPRLGLLITSVVPNGPFADAGIQGMDIILTDLRNPVVTITDCNEWVVSLQVGQTIQLYVMRYDADGDGRWGGFWVSLTLEARASAPGSGQSIAEDVWAGFRGITWGTEIGELEDMHLEEFVKDDDDKKWYNREKDKLAIGKAELRWIMYSFYKGRFASISIRAEGLSNWMPLRDAIFARYGEGYQPNEYIEEWWWFGKKGEGASMNLEFNEFTGEITVCMWSKVLQAEQEADEAEAAKAAGEDFD